MTRRMIDGIGANAPLIAHTALETDLIAWYGTGSPEIEWSVADRELFPHNVMVEIDQAFTGSPQLAATVRDVENGAWRMSDAVKREGWTAARPTLYFSRGLIPQAQEFGWDGDVWLADPGFSGTTAPIIPGMRVVAVQNVYAGNWDTSLVFDQDWPNLPQATKPPTSVSCQITSRRATLTFTRVEGAGHYVIFYTAQTGPQPNLITRCAQTAGGASIVLDNLPIPAGTGGAITVYAIVESKPIVVGIAHLP